MRLLLLILALMVSGEAWATNYCTSAAGCWLFTEGSGTTVDDSSPNSNTGTFKGSGEPAWDTTDVPFHTSGAAPNSVDFDGNDYIYKSSWTEVTNFPLTIVAWFRSDSLSDNNTIATICNSASDGDWLARVIHKTDGTVYIDVNQTSYRAKSTLSTCSVGNWCFATGVFTGSASRTVYLNASDAQTDTGSTTFILSNRFAIGVLGRLTPADYMDGAITDVAVFNTALSTTDISAIYDYGLSGQQSTTGGPSILRNSIIRNSIIR